MMRFLPQNLFYENYIYGTFVKSRTLLIGDDDCLLDGTKQEEVDSFEKSEDDTEREPETVHGMSYWEALMHLLKSCMGTAVFAMGSAFKNSGILLGPFLLLLMAVLTTHCQHILLSLSETLAKLMGARTCPNFAETIKLGLEMGPPCFRKLASHASKLVQFFLCVTHLGACCVYFIFIASNLRQLTGHFGHDLSTHSGMGIIFVPILLSCLIRHLKFLVPLSVVANVGIVLSISIIASFVAQDLPPVSSRNYVARWNQLPLFLGTVLFTFNGTGFIIPFRNEMKLPKNFSAPLGVLNLGTALVTGVLSFVGFTSYLKYGEEIQGTVTLNLPQDDALAQVVKVVTSLAILLSFALVFHVPAEILWGGIPKGVGPSRCPGTKEYLFRTFLVLLTLLLAGAIPYLHLFISLVGAISGPVLIMFFPPFVELVVLWSLSELSFRKCAANSAIISLGILICVTSTYETVKLIVEAVGSDQ